MNRLKEVMMLLIANDEPLPPEYLDHELTGEWHGFRECHIGGDFLLIYELRADGTIIFTSTGTHSALFD
jgi:mRNA interferase YafQ